MEASATALTYADWEGDAVVFLEDATGFPLEAYVNQGAGWKPMDVAEAFHRAKVLSKVKFEAMFPEETEELKKNYLGAEDAAADAFDPSEPRDPGGEWTSGGGVAKLDWSGGGGGSKTAKIGNTTITYGISRTGETGEVILVETPKSKRGQGEARHAMRQFLKQADQHGTTLFLNAHPMGKGVSRERLAEFYQSLGFVENAGEHKDSRSTAEYVRQPAEASGGTGIAGLPKGKLPRELDMLSKRGAYEMEATPVKRGEFESGDHYEVIVKAKPVPGIKTVGQGSRMVQYDPELAEAKTLNPEDPIITRETAEPKPGLATELPIKADPTRMYRGMDAEEFANFQKTGEIKSQSEYNMQGQEKLTYWSSDPREAASYSSGFAPAAFKPTFEKPAYVMVAKRVEPKGETKIKGTGETEIGVNRPVKANEVLEVWRGRVAAFNVGEYRISDRGDGVFEEHGGSSPNPWVVWDKVTPRIAADAEFDPSKHPRGQPKNAGQFVEGAVSTRITSEPQRRKSGDDPHKHPKSLVDWNSARAPEVNEWLKKATDLLVGNKLYTPGKKGAPTHEYVGMPKGPKGETPEQAAERFIKFAEGNLLAIYHAVPASWRDRASLWYEGAHDMAKKWGKDYGYSPQQVAGVIAALSPKKDWFQNVDIAKRILDITKTKQNVRFDAEADKRLREYIRSKGTLAERRAFRAIEACLKDDKGRWKTLGELKTVAQRAVWINMYDLAHGDTSYHDVSPEGKFLGLHTNKGEEGEEGAPGDPTVRVWATQPNIIKALNILDNGSTENISRNIGERHKVRNFYMNILDPWSGDGHVTIDTHAIGAAFMRPFGLDDEEVRVGLGGSPGNDTYGLSGTYPIIAEAYRRAAHDVGLLPRQMQSIVWEGWRGLFSPEAKRNEKLRSAVDAVWHRHMTDPKFTADKARAAVMKLGAQNGVPRLPAWVNQ